MINKPVNRESGAPLTRKQVLLVVAAGLASFAAAFVFQLDATGQEDDLVQVVSRDQRRGPIAARSEDAALAAATYSMSSQENIGVSASRMNRVVVRDPFGLLAPEPVAAPELPPAPPQQQPMLKSKRSMAAVVVPTGPPPPPPAPVAPPLPFIAVGSIQGQRIGDGQQQTFIQQGENLTLVRQGQTLNGTYRVDDINAERVLFTYLPLGQKQSLPLMDRLK